MAQNKKARSDVGTSEQARENAQAANPYTEDNFPVSNIQGLSALLFHGEQNAIPAAELAKAIGIDDTRDLRKLIERERCSGELILSSRKGYFLPNLDPARRIVELRRYCHVMDARLRSNRHSVRAVKRELKNISDGEIDGQGVIWDE